MKRGREEKIEEGGGGEGKSGGEGTGSLYIHIISPLTNTLITVERKRATTIIITICTH